MSERCALPSDPLEGFGVGRAGKECFQRLMKFGLVRGRFGKQGHRRAEFEIVRVPKDCVGGLVGMGEDGAGALDKPGAEGVVGEIGASLIKRAKRIALAHGTHPQPGNLRKDEPHPMTALLAGAEFGEGGWVDGGLGGEEVMHRCSSAH